MNNNKYKSINLYEKRDKEKEKDRKIKPITGNFLQEFNHLLFK